VPAASSFRGAELMSVYQPKYKNPDGTWSTSPTWWIEFKDHCRARRRVQGYPAKRATEDLERRIMELVYVRASGGVPSADLRVWCERLSPRLRAKLVEFGLLDKSHVAAAAPIDDHVKSWEAHLKSSGTGEKRREAVAERVRKVI